MQNIIHERFKYFRILPVLIFSMIGPSNLQAQQELWRKIQQSDLSGDMAFDDTVTEIIENETVIDAALIQVNVDLLRQNLKDLAMPFFDDWSERFVRENFYTNQEGSFFWQGASRDGEVIQGEAHLLLERDGRLTGKIFTAHGFYLIQPLKHGSHVLLEKEIGLFECGIDTTNRDLTSKGPREPPQESIKRAFEVSVLVVYTGQAEALPGSIIGEIDMAEADGYLSIQNTEDDYLKRSRHYRVVHKAKIDYAEDGLGNPGLAFDFMRSSREIANLRDAYRADVVILVMRNILNVFTFSVGEAYKIGVIDQGVAFDEAYAVINRAALQGERAVMLHEVGHLLGGVHKGSNNSGPTHGFLEEMSNPPIATIMTSTAEFSCGPASCLSMGGRHWSNPNQRFGIFAIGSSLRSNNKVHIADIAWVYMADLWRTK